jgi:hypothetical protein
MTPSPSRSSLRYSRDPDTGSPLALVAASYLSLFPLLLLLSFNVKGARATGADAFVALVVLVALGQWLARGFGRGRREEGKGEGPSREAPEKLPVPFAGALAALGGYALWVGLSTLWSDSPEYAFLKGVGILALVAGAAGVATSGMGWGRAADAWLTGTGVVLGFSLLALVVPSGLGEWMTYGGGGVSGLPLPRLKATFSHPNALGDYLLISAGLLWARWPEYSGTGRRWAWVLAGLMALAFLGAVTTAWVGVGGLLLGLALAGGRERRALLGLGAILTVSALAAVLLSFRLPVPGLEIHAAGVRPEIWGSALSTYATSPFLGVGATPDLAAAPAPGSETMALALWDAHSLYLSVLGQYGVAGFVLFFGGFSVLIWSYLRGDPGRRRTAVLAVLLALALHGLVTASEDMRHLWAFVGVVGLGGGGSFHPGKGS